VASNIKGLKSLQQKLARLPDKVKIRIRAAMEAGADEIIAMMKALVAVDDGNLRDSINWTWGSAPSGSISVASVISGDLTITIYAGDDYAYYARWVEFGTAAHNIASGGGTKAGQKQLASGGGRGHPGTQAQPFFYVSYRALRKRTKSRITRSINKAAKEVAAGGG
jgi:HK97 gp10 family phage protein